MIWLLILSIGLVAGTIGGIVGTLTVGSRLAKRLMHTIDAARFRHLMDALLAVAGLIMLAGALS
jgi:uncharacterized membrane protein YfcA